MNLVLKTPYEPPGQAGLDFSVVITCAYESSPKVCEVLQLLLHILKEEDLKEEEGRLLYQTWNIDALAFIENQEMAEAEAALADMVIVGIHKEHELLKTAGPWINRWISLRNGRPGALVMVLNSDFDKPGASQEAISQLKQAAASASMDFFVTKAKDEVDALGISEAARQLVLTHHAGAQNVLPGWVEGGGEHMEQMEMT